MNSFFKILLAAIQAYLTSFGNKSKVIEAVFDETKNEVITTFSEVPKETPKVLEVPPSGATSLNQAVPGPSTFNKPVDKTYGSNRKH